MKTGLRKVQHNAQSTMEYLLIFTVVMMGFLAVQFIPKIKNTFQNHARDTMAVTLQKKTLEDGDFFKIKTEIGDAWAAEDGQQIDPITGQPVQSGDGLHQVPVPPSTTSGAADMKSWFLKPYQDRTWEMMKGYGNYHQPWYYPLGQLPATHSLFAPQGQRAPSPGYIWQNFRPSPYPMMQPQMMSGLGGKGY